MTSSAFTISEVAADWHEPMVPQRIMWPSIARDGFTQRFGRPLCPASNLSCAIDTTFSRISVGTTNLIFVSACLLVYLRYTMPFCTTNCYILPLLSVSFLLHVKYTVCIVSYDSVVTYVNSGLLGNTLSEPIPLDIVL